MKINIPYGNTSIKLSLPEERLLGVLENKSFRTKSAGKLLLRAMRQKDVPFRKKKVLIVVADATRNCHLKEILSVLLDEITIPSRKIDIMIATGLHEKHSPEMLQKLLGSPVLKRHKILHHDPYGAAIMDFGRTEHGVPVTLNKALFDYDFIISIGVIEPHLYAGYSGGAKTVAIGLAGKGTIDATHSIRFLDHPSVAIGSLDGNPFQETLWHITENIPPVFAVNVVNDQRQKALKVFAGPVKEVFKKGTDFARSVFEAGVKELSDIAICGIGYPKDINLYQASRAVNYILSVDRPIVRKGGVVIVAADLRDGIGRSPAEIRFYEELKSMSSPQGFIERVKAKGCVAGEHRAYMVAKALLEHSLIFVTGADKEFMKNLPIKYCTDLSEALNLAQGIVGGKAKIYAVPHALGTIARLDCA